MVDRILFPTDGAASVFEHVLDLAGHHATTVTILNVADTTQDSVCQVQEGTVGAPEQGGEQIVQNRAERAHGRGVDTATDVVRDNPYRKIIDDVETRRIDLVVVPTHGRRGLERFLLGSTTERVVRRADVPGLTIGPDSDFTTAHPCEDVLVPTDGSDCVNQALAIDVDVVDPGGATLHPLSVIAITTLGADVRQDIQMEPLEDSTRGPLDEVEAVAESADVGSIPKTVEYGPSSHEAVLTHVEEQDVDLVVVGSHGRTCSDRHISGSVTDHLVRTSPVPVPTVRAPESAT